MGKYSNFKEGQNRSCLIQNLPNVCLLIIPYRQRDYLFLTLPLSSLILNCGFRTCEQRL